MRRTHEDIHDEWLVLRCQEGDAEALTALIGRWQPRMARFAWRLTGEWESARDIVQEAWLAIVRGLPGIDDPARFRTWAYRVVRNKCADWTRRRAVQRRADGVMRCAAKNESVSNEANDAAPAEGRDDIAQLRAVLSTLPDEQRAVLSLHYLDGMSVSEIAFSLEIPEGTVKSRLYHARNRLKTAFERVDT